ncbi:glycosyltransferase [Anaerorhabdus sp.]|uniref:glycosyltransferase n=1 Tax=Anaerorhabdus sp. TaxID=1872524 RepID=UPI002FC9168E
MKKILLVNDFLEGGGVERLLWDFYEYFQKDYEISFCILYKPNKDIQRKYSKYKIIYAQKKEVNIHILGFLRNIENDIMKFITLRLIELRKFDYILVMKEGHCMKFFENIDCRNKFAWVHTDYYFNHWTKSVYSLEDSELDIMKKYKKIICGSRSTMNSINDILGNPGNLSLCYNPIKEDRIIALSLEVNRLKEEYAKNIVSFSSIGRLCDQKAYNRLIIVFHRLKLEGYLFKVNIIGDGEEYYKIKDKIKELNLENDIILHGAMDNPYPIIRKSDWYLCCSKWEAFGLTIQEAKILNIPIIITNMPAALELFEVGIDGFVAENNIEGIYITIKKVLDDTTIMEKIKTNQKHIVPYSERMDTICKLLKGDI